MSDYTYGEKSIWQTLPESVDMLRNCVALRMSASETAAKMTETFGVPITPNTVIGKAHRLKIRFDSNSKNNTFAKHGQGRARASRAVPKAPKPITVARKPPSVAEFVPEPVAIPVSRRVSIDELTFNSCRWPLGDPRSSDFAFCGADRADPHNAFNQYCATHAALAFVPTSKKVNLWRVA